MTVATLVAIAGIASQYSPGTMTQVANVRTWQGWPIASLPHIAVSGCDDVGKIRAIRYAGRNWESAQVIDCARAGDGSAEWMEQNSILLEMSYSRAVELGTVGRGIPVEMVAVEFEHVESCPTHCIVMKEARQ